MQETVLIIGGCRSGKSRYALEMAEQVAGGQERIFIATLVPQDQEMEERIRRHQKERSPKWKTIETPLYLPEAINEHSRRAGVIVVDCLTLWLNNLLMENHDVDKIDLQIQQLTQALEAAQCPVYF
jgi:adenosylcobinamide kinase/adenosylcobinamide-phosphate guanylyltransferase